MTSAADGENSLAERIEGRFTTPTAVFQQADGEMSALVRSFDWSTTPIGPIDSWSPALRMIVPFLLANRFPLLLWWGPEYISIYNDAYRPVLGTKHPWALGRSVSEVWSETWNVLQPLIDTPFQGGPATWDDDLRLEIDRYGFVEETHFTVAYSPVPDDLAPNGVGGVLATVHEITQEVVSERRIVALRDLSARTSGAKSATEACRIAAECLAGHPLDIPFAFLYLTDPDGGLARLAGATGAELGTDISPLTVDVRSPRADGWPLADAISMGATRTVQCLDDRFEVVPTGPWSTPPNTALVMPIPSSQPDQPEGLIVVGISSHLRLDENYHRFLELVRTQIATAIANARAHEAERRRAEMLAELDRAKTTFFSNVSHEFRTPLTLLLGPLEDLLAAEDRALPAEQREQLTIAHRNALRLLRLVNTLLDFSRVEAGRIQATFDQVDLPSLTADLASTFRSAIERAGLELVVDCPPLPEGFEAYVDREMWEKIVLNLVSNAFKHTFKGQISVSLHPLLERDCLELKVSDTGTGIPAGELPRIFERFYRVRSDKARTYEGTGIGLALVQEMVKLHGGSIEVESEPGQGTTFTVTVPAGAAHLPEDSIGVARSGASTALGAAPFIEEALRWLPDDPGSSQSDSGSELLRADRSLIDGGARSDPRRQAKSARVLVADDNADMRDYISRLLGGQYAVQAVRDGEAALQAARANLPDLVLADVMMPRLDGFGLLQALRGDPKTRDIPILLLSARAGEEARVEGLEAGADDYLVKPFSARELIARVDGHIQLGRIRREKAEVEEMARQAAETERDRLNEMFLQAPALICVLRGPNHVYEMANPLYLEVVGRRDILGKPIRQALPELEGQPFFDLLDHVYATGEPYVGRQVPARLDRDGDGIPEQVYFDFVYQRIHGAPGQGDGVFVHGIDVTHQVRATERIRRLQGLTVQLSRSLDVDEMLNTIARSAASLLELPVGAVFLLDPDEPDGDFSLVSAHGIEPGRAAGLRLPRHASLAGSAVDEDRTLAVDDVSKASGTALPELLTGEPTGSEIAAPITADSQPLGAVKAFSHTLHRFGADDAAVLDALAAAASVALTNARLYQQSQEALRERDAFMSEAAHDLKTPLTNIKGQAQLLQRQAAHINDPYTERIIAGLKNIDTVVTKLAAQVDELRDAAHRDLSQSARFHRGQADIVAVVRKAVAEQERAASLHRFEVITEFQQIIGPWDATQLTRVVDNLLANAVKYSPNGGDVTLEMIREIAVARTWAVLTVRDHGLGIPSSDLPHVFERLHRGANVVNQFAGTGIGLASAKQIVERLGGTIEVESQEGAGSIFTVRLPLDDFATATST